MRLAAWLGQLDGAVASGRRPDVELSALLRRERPDPALRRRLVLAQAAWFRWSRLLGAAPDPLCDLDQVLRMEKLARGPGGPASALATLPDPPAPASLLPRWLLEDLPAGRDADALALALLRPPSLWLRADDEIRLRRGLGGLAGGLSAHPQLVGAWRLETREDLYGLEAFRRGDFVLQDPASQAIGAACGARPGQHWLDLCAGAGGKSLQLAAAMGGKGLVHAFDIHAGRIEELRRRARRQGVFNLEARLWDGQVLPALPRLDGVLVDAPCTNSGTLRRNPDLWRRPRPDVEGLLEIQRALIRRAAALLGPGGRLVYATCSVLAGENEGQLAEALGLPAGLVEEEFDHPLHGGRARGGLRLDPLDGDQDGTYVAVLRKA